MDRGIRHIGLEAAQPPSQSFPCCSFETLSFTFLLFLPKRKKGAGTLHEIPAPFLNSENKKHPSAGIKPSGQVSFSLYAFLENKNSALFEILENQKGRLAFQGSVSVRILSVPKKAIFRSLVFFLKLRLKKSLKRPIGCAFTRIRSKLTFIDGAGSGGRTHTVSLPPDFESGASANSTIPAYMKYLLIIVYSTSHCKDFLPAARSRAVFPGKTEEFAVYRLQYFIL